ncbi:MAG: hypothetical protein KDA42_07295 [Planctomycetales bacterium]|nr:hypothetical protein [Planctomycetales bacterium]
MIRTWMLPVLTFAIVAPVPLVAQEKKEAKDAKEAAPETVAVEQRPLRVTVEVDGVFVAEKASEISLQPQAWQPWEIESVARHGDVVRKGDVLLQFKAESLQLAIAELEAEIGLNTLALEAAKRDQPRVEAARRLGLQAAEVSAKTAGEDLEHFLKVEKEFGRKGAEVSLDSARAYLEYATEELEQLEKMYEADDLTEETEEIILKRQRRAVEMAKFSLEQAELGHDEYFKFGEPRREQSLRQHQQTAALALEQTKLAAQVAAGQQQIAVQKAARDLEQAKKKLARLTADRQLLAIRAPHDGVVYYGKSVDGKWPQIAALAAQLTEGGTVKPRDVLMTIVAQNVRSIAARLPEKHLSQARPGMQAAVSPTGMPDEKLAALVDTVSAIPIADGQFELTLRLLGANEAPPLAAGMTCKLKIDAYRNPQALTLPKSAVATDELDDSRYVMLVDKSQDTPQRRAVQVGKESGDYIEIVAGLAQDDRVVKSPKGKKKDE